jgi:hypothetical protein
MTGDQSKNSLWAMMEGTLSSSLALANDIKGETRNESGGRAKEPVYFDRESFPSYHTLLTTTTFLSLVFGMIMIVFTFQTLWIMNIVLLTVGPVVILLSVYFEHIVRATSRIRSGYYRTANDDLNRQNFFACVTAAGKDAIKGCFVWSKFWIALSLGVGFQLLLVVGYAKVNPFVSV